jgi:hypothetical protein
MLIVYTLQNDTSIPAPVEQTVQSLNSGLQLAF